MASQQSDFIDPKNAHLFKLSNIVDRIAWTFAFSDTEASKLLASLFAEINIDADEKELHQLQENYVLQYETFLANLKKGESRRHFFYLMQYMNRTYFRGWSNAKPKFGSEGKL